jgi:divalent metal cation (Fe/Co/Zn/Cd) transporter
MMNGTEASNLAGQTPTEHKKKISLFWLIAGGLLMFFGVESILYTANIWTKADVEYADDLVLVGIGAAIIIAALRSRE